MSSEKKRGDFDKFMDKILEQENPKPKINVVNDSPQRELIKRRYDHPASKKKVPR